MQINKDAKQLYKTKEVKSLSWVSLFEMNLWDGTVRVGAPRSGCKLGVPHCHFLAYYLTSPWLKFPHL